MANKPSRGNTGPLAHFTDRKEQIDAFDALWEPGRSTWVLAFEGMSGNGKTTLIQWLIHNRCIPQKLPYTLVNLESITTRTDFDELIGQLAAGFARRPYRRYGQERRRILQEWNRKRGVAASRALSNRCRWGRWSANWNGPPAPA